MNEERKERILAVIRKIDDFAGEYETAFIYETMQAELDDIQTEEELAYDRMSEEEKNGAAGTASKKADAILDKVLDLFEETLSLIEEYVTILDEEGTDAAAQKKGEIKANLLQSKALLQTATE